MYTSSHLWQHQAFPKLGLSNAIATYGSCVFPSWSTGVAAAAAVAAAADAAAAGATEDGGERPNISCRINWLQSYVTLREEQSLEEDPLKVRV